MSIEAEDLSLEELDYHLEEGATIEVEQKGSNNNFVAVIDSFATTDVASGVAHAKLYDATITEVKSGDYLVNDSVRVDNRDVVRIFDD